MYAKVLLAGGYVPDPSIFFLSGGGRAQYTGTIASASSSIVQENVGWDFADNSTAPGLSSVNYPYIPILWTCVAGGTAANYGVGGTTAITATLSTLAPFGTDGLAVFYANNSSKFITATAAGGTVTVVPGPSNSGEASSITPNTHLGGS